MVSGVVSRFRRGRARFLCRASDDDETKIPIREVVRDVAEECFALYILEPHRTILYPKISPTYFPFKYLGQSKAYTCAPFSKPNSPDPSLTFRFRFLFGFNLTRFSPCPVMSCRVVI